MGSLEGYSLYFPTSVDKTAVKNYLQPALSRSGDTSISFGGGGFVIRFEERSEKACGREWPFRIYCSSFPTWAIFRNTFLVRTADDLFHGNDLLIAASATGEMLFRVERKVITVSRSFHECVPWNQGLLSKLELKIGDLPVFA